MPRLTNSEYLDRCHWLCQVWLDPHRTPLIILTPNEQWDIHAYFQPSRELSDEELISHRKQLLINQPGLPARAGKVFNKMVRVIDSAREKANGDPKLTMHYIHDAAHRSTVVDKRGRKHHTYAIVKPEPDLDKLAQALLGLARQMQREEDSQAS